MSTEQAIKAKLKWPVSIKANGSSSEGVTLNLSTNQAYIRCAKPLRLNEVFDMILQVPNSDDSIEAEVEVVFSNIYGPDDDISPRGMIVRFLELSSEDRRIIAKAIFKQLESDNVEIDPKHLQTLQTLTIDPNEIGSKAA
ncbi:MAG: PilZ domain-containing protein [Syntrophobacteria bacterium]